MAHCPVRCPAPRMSDWLIWCPMEQRTPRLVLLEEPYQGQRIHQSIHPADGGTGLDTASILVNKRETQSEKALNWGYFLRLSLNAPLHVTLLIHHSSTASVLSSPLISFSTVCITCMYVFIYSYTCLCFKELSPETCVYLQLCLCVQVYCVCVWFKAFLHRPCQCHLL